MWHLNLRIQSISDDDTKALAACLATDCETTWQGHAAFTIQLDEAHCKDLRAMWNTRMRGLIATNNVLEIFRKDS
jgi:hypothetical protein